MNKICIIIPIHFIKRKFVKRLIHTFNHHNNSQYADIFFILTNKLEYNKYKKYIFGFNYLILPGTLNHNIIAKNKIYPSFKKFWALEQITKINKYQYSICIDCEVHFFSLKNIYNICKYFCQQKTVFGGNGNIKNINGRCLDFIKLFHKENTNIDINTYFWFSQFPIYDMQITKEFLKFINFENYEFIISNMDWYCFEYIIYIYYCIIFHNYKITNLNNIGLRLNGSLERKLNKTNLDFIRKNNFSINWQSNRHNNILDENIIMLYHLDTN